VTICDPTGSRTGEAYDIMSVYSVLPIYIYRLDKGLNFLYKKKQIASDRLCRAIRIMFEIKTEEIGRKGCVMWSCIIYTACHIMKEHWQMGEECSMHETEGDLQHIFDWKT
jgi:hypothetical protein